ncbi:MAG: phospho-N-acetylmuramoyl-pentapeptide-transferase [Ruminococcaceae bacterium]|jgi:phospho-N-acetylmuramoyl-pentapeptide-transferase|nr:phospho-N-acetylmuramoyl-pentapeptide-transferase [Oscillospiraceae bacterium]
MNRYFALALTAVVSFIVAFLLGFVLIPWLRKLKFGQTILDIGPAWHKSKQGTPVMGGLMFIISTIVSIAATVIASFILKTDIIAGESVNQGQVKIKIYAGILLAIGFGAIGFLDDYIKVVKKRNKGLSIIQKTIPQLVISLAYLGTLYQSGSSYMYIPFVGNVDMKWFFFIFGICVIYGGINAVNFTDGVDGLCASVTAAASVGFIAIAVLHGYFGVGIVASALFGGCLGYLIWNWHPAKVMMGDTGSMFLGGLVVALAYMVDCPLILLFIGIIYVIEGMSDVIQIGYFKITHGKRIFKMAPIHHHFEMCGWKETKIVTVFTVINLIGAIIGAAIYYYGKIV